MTRRENDLTLQSRHKSSQSPYLHEHGATEIGGVNGNNYSNTHSPPAGFVAVNANRSGDSADDQHNLAPPFMFSHPNAENITIINGTSIKGASPTTRAELMKKFFTTADRQARGYSPEEEPPSSLSRQSARPARRRSSDAADLHGGVFSNSAGTVAIPSTPSSLLPQPKSINPFERDDGGPYKIEMVARMEELQRGERIIPPCDRCRRLHMDCLKNLTACMGCTKKHAKCSWRDVKEDEIRGQQLLRHNHEQADVRDSGRASMPAVPTDNREGRETDHTHEPSGVDSNGGRADSTSSAPILGSEPQQGLPDLPAPRRAASAIESSALRSVGANHDRRISHHRSLSNDDNDPDANSRLMQAILDTVDHHARVQAGKDREREREREGDRTLTQ